MELDLVGKTAIVTGGASHIGRRIALDLASEGATVVIADVDDKQSHQVSDEAKQNGWKVEPIRCDVTSVESVEGMIKKTLDGFGQVDILVNNAGWTADRLFVEKPRHEWEKEININLWGPINCIRAVVDHMIERRYGKIISVDSDAGRSGEVREVVYGAAKAGAIGLTKGLAKELGRFNINVNAVSPSLTLPDSQDEVGELSLWHESSSQAKVFGDPAVRERIAKAYPLRRIGNANDVSPMVVFLASDLASFITGQTISVNGGYII